MRITSCKRVYRYIFAALAAWSVWKLPRRVAVFVVAVIAADLAAIGLAASFLSVRSHDVVLFCLLVACNAATVELTRRAGEPAGVIKDVHAVWELPVAILLPPLYAFIAPVIRMALLQWRVRGAPLYRRIFTAAALGLAFGAASLTFHTLSKFAIGPAPTPGSRASLWIVAVAVCGVLEWAVNNTLVLTAVKGSDPSVRVRDMVFSREPLFNDITELCVAFLVAFGAASSSLVVLFAFPFVILLQRSLRHSQLVNDSRIDSKTGLLNAGTWQREATAEVARASRTKNPLAVALVDIDKFKAVNDTYGHLVGDQVLKEISRSFHDYLREYDLAGRFGGEEFVLLLPHTTSSDAYRIAERMREHIAGMPIGLDGAAMTEPVHVTVSIGVAVLDATRRDLTDLLAAADAALYRAKESGRDQVRMVTGQARAVTGADPDPDSGETADSGRPGQASDVMPLAAGRWPDLSA
jgi:diguanylate cyclase (GGDEF)-like protein